MVLVTHRADPFYLGSSLNPTNGTHELELLPGDGDGTSVSVIEYHHTDVRLPPVPPWAPSYKKAHTSSSIARLTIIININRLTSGLEHMNPSRILRNLHGLKHRSTSFKTSNFAPPRMQRMSATTLPTFPEDIPTHPLLVIDYELIKARDEAEMSRLWEAGTKLGFW
jgi:hypothetical protein